MDYWTIPYVAIHDFRLKLLYNTGLGVLFSYLCLSFFVHQTYLEADPISGISRLRLKSPDFSQFPKPEDGGRYVLWDSDEVASHVDDGILIATRVKDIIGELNCPKGGDLSCLTYDVKKKHEFFPKHIENFTLSLTGYGEARHFCKSERSNHHGRCSYSYDTRSLEGQLLASDGRVIRKLLPGREHEEGSGFPLSSWLHAAGVDLDDLNSYNRTFRDKGMTLMVVVDFDLHESVGFWDALWASGMLGNAPKPLPMRYTLQVTLLFDADFKQRNVIGHHGSTRITRSTWGIKIKVVTSGRAYRWSFTSLLNTLVLQLGLLTLLSQILDFFWQFILPKLDTSSDYNSSVFTRITSTMEEAREKKD